MLKLEYMEFKSAVAFFFLFFLHGTSIGNGQQGISYNVSQLGEVVESKYKCSVQQYTSIDAQTFKLPRNPPFCQTAVRRWHG